MKRTMNNDARGARTLRHAIAATIVIAYCAGVNSRFGRDSGRRHHPPDAAHREHRLLPLTHRAAPTAPPTGGLGLDWRSWALGLSVLPDVLGRRGLAGLRQQSVDVRSQCAARRPEVGWTSVGSSGLLHDLRVGPVLSGADGRCERCRLHPGTRRRRTSPAEHPGLVHEAVDPTWTTRSRSSTRHARARCRRRLR